MMKFYQSLPPQQQRLAPYLALVFAVFAAYSNVYGNAFLFDDGLIITRNELLHHWSTFGHLFTASTTDGAHISGGFYRPLQNILYFFVYQIFGESPFGFHLLNISLHAANACLVFTLGRKLSFNTGATFLATLLWALHPIHTEAVTYMSSTADTLHTLFCLIGLIILLPDFTLRKFITVTPIFLLAVFSKEAAIIFPVLTMVCLYLVSPQRLRPQTYRNTWPLWIVTAIYLSWRLTTSHLDGPATYHRIYQQADYYNLWVYSTHLSMRIYTFMATLPAYLQLLVYPVGLHMERSFTIYADFWVAPVLIGALMLLAGTIQIFLARDKGRPLSFGLLWFGAVHFPDTGLFVPMNSLFLEHWMYLPTIGLCLGAAQTIYLYTGEKKHPHLQHIAVTFSLLVSLALATGTLIQNAVWRDPITFYTHLFKYGVVSARAHNNLALAYMEKGEFNEAIDEYHRALAITDTYAETRHNLAVSLLNLPDRENHIQEAIEHLHRALEIDPHFYRSYIALSEIYKWLGDTEKAAYYRQQADEALQKYHP